MSLKKCLSSFKKRPISEINATGYYATFYIIYYATLKSSLNQMGSVNGILHIQV